MSARAFNNKISSYRKAIITLNNFRDPEGITNRHIQEDVRTSRQRMTTLLEECGMTVSQLDNLNIIHVTGTKGKGSTCALTERMLRSLGYKTGLYTSPQLIHTTERFRINGTPISRETFNEHFYELEENFLKFCDEDPVKVRRYHKVCTALAFRIFLREKVDVAIIETGIGGEICHSNIIQNPKVTMNTVLDYDHTNVLGKTLPEIAWNKSGIFKKNSHAITIKPVPEAWKVLQKRAKERQVSTFSIAPTLSSYNWNDSPRSIGLSGVHQQQNASIALQGTRAWLKSMKEEAKHFSSTNWQPGQPFTVSSPLKKAIEDCKFPGRNQIVAHGNLTFHMDCAHTPMSVEAAVKWFQDTVKTSNRRRVLVYYISGRDPFSLWNPLKGVHFDDVIFCPSLLNGQWEPDCDMGYRRVDGREQLDNCRSFVEKWKNINADQHPIVRPSVNSTLEWLVSNSSESSPMDVFVLGFFINGVFMRAIDPTLPLKE